MTNERIITEREFVENEQRRLHRLSNYVTYAMRDLGLSACEIGRQTGLDRRTIQKMVDEVQVNPQSEERVRLYLDRRYNKR